MAAPMGTCLLYTRASLLSMRDFASRLDRCTRKVLFSSEIWRPKYVRLTRTLGNDVDPHCPSVSPPPQPPSSLPSVPSSPGIRLATWNIHSLRNKYHAVAAVLTDSIDLLVITESWHQSSTDVAVRRSAPPGYSTVDCPRPGCGVDGRWGGGILIVHRDTLRVRGIPLVTTPTTFEAVAVAVSSSRGPLTVLAIYRPGSALPSAAFFSEFALFLEQFALYNTQLVVTGDLNIHLEDPLLSHTMDFLDILDQYRLTQHVTESTQREGGWLDVIITRDDCALRDISIHPPTISDHGLVLATIPFLSDAPSYFISCVRDWRRLDREAFKAALLSIPAVVDPSVLEALPVADAFAVYESAMTEVLHQFLPTRQARVRRLPLSPWFDAECRSRRRGVRLHERRYRRTRSSADRTAWVRSVREIHKFYHAKERDYWEAKITAHAGQPKRLWATFNALLGRGRKDRCQDPLPFTVDDYLSAFTIKVLDVRKDTANSPPPVFPPTSFDLSTLAPVTATDLRRLILASAPKSCELDPLPTSLLQEFVDVLLPLITFLCNYSVREGTLPESQKRSILVPVLKCEGLDEGNPNNYRPIANVSFVSKIVEKIVALQLTTYLEAHNLLPTIRSGFRKSHSTETLLLRLLSDAAVLNLFQLADHLTNFFSVRGPPKKFLNFLGKFSEFLTTFFSHFP